MHSVATLPQERPGLAGQAMAHLFQAVRRYVNFFQPSFKLIEKFRDSAVTVKRHSPPATPCDRLIEHDASGDELKAWLNEYRSSLDPVLLHAIREAHSALVAATSPEVRETPHGESLSKFLAKLPSLWQQGEVHPTHVVKVRVRRCRGTPARTPSKACGPKCWLGCRPCPVRLPSR